MSWKAGKPQTNQTHRAALIPPGPIYPCNPATIRAESTKLASDPKGEKLVYTNGRVVIVSVRLVTR
jgi:hypothetical protein